MAASTGTKDMTIANISTAIQRSNDWGCRRRGRGDQERSCRFRCCGRGEGRLARWLGRLLLLMLMLMLMLLLMLLLLM